MESDNRFVGNPAPQDPRLSAAVFILKATGSKMEQLEQKTRAACFSAANTRAQLVIANCAH